MFETEWLRQEGPHSRKYKFTYLFFSAKIQLMVFIHLVEHYEVRIHLFIVLFVPLHHSKLDKVIVKWIKCLIPLSKIVGICSNHEVEGLVVQS